LRSDAAVQSVDTVTAITTSWALRSDAAIRPVYTITTIASRRDTEGEREVKVEVDVACRVTWVAGLR
jgi:hypothetical protein